MPEARYKPEPPFLKAFVQPHRSNVLIHYFADVFDWHGYVKFLSLAALRDTSQDVPIEKLFVEPHVSPQHLLPDMLEASPAPDSEPVSRAIEANPALVILGDPGSGKSTIVNWICSSLATKQASVITKTLPEGMVPLPFVLRELGIGEQFASLGAAAAWRKLLELFLQRPVASRLKKAESRGEDGLISKMLESGQAFLLFDGIDEIGSISLRQALREAVHEGMRRYPRCRWLFTSRVVGFEEVPFDQLSSGKALWPSNLKALARMVERPDDIQKPEPLAARLYVAPFEDRQIEQFTYLWWAQHESNPHLAGAKPKDFVRELKQSHGARSLARLPHLLTMIAQIYRVRAHLPDGRAILYSDIANTYLGTLDKQRGLPIPRSLEEMKEWLAAVAWQLQSRRSDKNKSSESETLIDEKDLIRLLESVIRPSSRDDPKQIAKLFLNYAARRSGLLLPRGQNAAGEDRYAFLHLSFQEYFAAEYLRERVADPGWWSGDPSEASVPGTSLDDVRKYAEETAWHETLIFLWEGAAFSSKALPSRLLARLNGWKNHWREWADFDLPAVKDSWEPSSNRIALVAGLSINPHVVLDPPERERVWELCFRWEIRSQQNLESAAYFWEWKPVVCQKLLLRPAGEHSTLRTFARVVREEKPERLSFSEVANPSYIPTLGGILSLKELILNWCSELIDLEPLRPLTNLQSLSLSCTGVRDLEPLRRLQNLHWLSLSHTAVRELAGR